jgi:hypothetical protein
MLPDKLVSLFIRKGVSPEARRIIENIRSTEPSRSVGSGSPPYAKHRQPNEGII